MAGTISHYGWTLCGSSGQLSISHIYEHNLLLKTIFGLPDCEMITSRLLEQFSMILMQFDSQYICRIAGKPVEQGSTVVASRNIEVSSDFKLLTCF